MRLLTNPIAIVLLVAVVAAVVFKARAVFRIVLVLLIVLLVYGVYAAVRDSGVNLTRVRGEITASAAPHS